MKLVQHNGHLVGAEDLVLKHQGVGRHSADYAPIRFQLSMG